MQHRRINIQYHKSAFNHLLSYNNQLMNDNATPIEKLLSRVEGYGKTSIELFKLNAIDKSADAASTFVSNLVIFIMLAFSFVIVNIGFALWLGTLLGDAFYGFFAVGGFYIILTVPLYIFREQWIKYPISNSIIKQFLKEK